MVLGFHYFSVLRLRALDYAGYQSVLGRRMQLFRRPIISYVVGNKNHSYGKQNTRQQHKSSAAVVREVDFKTVCSIGELSLKVTEGHRK